MRPSALRLIRASGGSADHGLALTKALYDPAELFPANTALRDADLLRRKLIGAADPIAAIEGYEEEMLDYGFAAVRRSLRNARQARSANRLARHAFRGFLRLASATPPIRKAIAAGLGA